jgi:EAL domain-containing protein (putative c-di-GMP-specific phosphodiesterase class I)
MTSTSGSGVTSGPDLTRDLPGAVGRGEILAYYQPQFDVRANEVVAVEVLARWRHPELGLVAPAHFIPLAEQMGLIDELGDHMFGLGCDSALDWQRHGRTIEVAVNVSALQLARPDYARRMLAAVEARSLDPRMLTIEVTESTEIVDVSAVADRLDWLKSVGMTISVDDFGTGHSSIDQVLQLRATELKIDQSLVRDDRAEATRMLARVVSFAHGHHLRVVAEGVETEPQRARIEILGCDRAQGYLFGYPLEKVALDRLLDRSAG